MVKHALRTIVGVSTVPQYTSYSKFANSRSDSYHRLNLRMLTGDQTGRRLYVQKI
jgi:hypothetical protein